MRRLLSDRPSAWIAVRRAYAAGLQAAEIARELGIDVATVDEFLVQGWRKALAEQHREARRTGWYVPLNGGERICMRAKPDQVARSGPS
jgi:transposase